VKRASSLMLVLGLLALLVASPAAGKTKTKTFTRCYPVAAGFLIDKATLGLDMPVSVPKLGKKTQVGKVTGVTASVRITHTDAQDLLISLVSPAGKAIALAVRRGGIGDGFGSGSTGCDGSLVTFTDASAIPIATPGNTGDNPVVGSLKPEQPFSTFFGGPAAGIWTLVTTDAIDMDTGAVTAFGMTVTYTYKTAKKKPKK